MNHRIYQFPEIEVHSVYIDECLRAILHSIVFLRTPNVNHISTSSSSISSTSTFVVENEQGLKRNEEIINEEETRNGGDSLHHLYSKKESDSSDSWENTDLESVVNDKEIFDPFLSNGSTCVVPIDVYCPRLGLSYPKVGIHYYEKIKSNYMTIKNNEIINMKQKSSQTRMNINCDEEETEFFTELLEEPTSEPLRQQQQKNITRQESNQHNNYGDRNNNNNDDNSSGCISSNSNSNTTINRQDRIEDQNYMRMHQYQNPSLSLNGDMIKVKRVMEGLDEYIDHAIDSCSRTLSDAGPELKKGKLKLSFFEVRKVTKFFRESKERIMFEEWEIPLLVEMTPPPVGTDISSEREQKMYQKKAQDCLKSTLKEIYQKIEGPIETNLPYEFEISFGEYGEQNVVPFYMQLIENRLLNPFNPFR